MAWALCEWWNDSKEITGRQTTRMKTNIKVMSNWTWGVNCGCINMEKKIFGHNKMTIRREESQCQTERAEALKKKDEEEEKKMEEEEK